MADARATRLFKSGNSVAVRIPASFGAKAGQKVEVRQDGDRWIIDPKPDEPKYIDVSGFAGKAPWLEPLTREEREIEPSADWSYFDAKFGTRER